MRALTGPLAMARIMVIMAGRRRYFLLYAPAVKKHLQTIEAKYHFLIRRQIEEQLQFEPSAETRNRKPLRQPAAFGAEWEIRFGPLNRFRVLYDIDTEQGEVRVLAIGEKRRDRLLIGGEEVKL
jgi:mRNA-degrading endonuclease RelE of RelBE toxin-antitoxin system